MTGSKEEMLKKNAHAAEDDEILQGLFTKYAINGKDGIKVITKDKAYLAAQQWVKQKKNLKGDELNNYVKENFPGAWEEHDIHKKNKIDVTEAYQMLKEL